MSRFLILSLSIALAGGATAAGQDNPAAPAAAPAGFPISAERLRSELARQLADHFRMEGDFQLDFLRPWTPPAETAASWGVEVLEYPTIPTSTMMVRCRLVADGAPEEEFSIQLRASLWRDAWFTRQPETTGSDFEPAALEARRVDCLRERNALPASAGDRSYMFARDVGADRMVTWQDIKRRPLVRKGEVVDVVASEGPLLVTLKALALESGGQGDLITVRNLESHKEIPVLVVSENRTVVSF